MMSLTKPEKLTAHKLAANRRNARRSRGPRTPEGKRRAAAANLRHGFYSGRWRDSMLALGEDPWEFDEFLDSLIETWRPANGFEMALVHRLARTLWRMERGERIQDSLAAERVRGAAENVALVSRVTHELAAERLPLLKALATNLARENYSTQVSDIKLFAQTWSDEPGAKGREILTLLQRLRQPGTRDSEMADACPAFLPGVAAAEGEEREQALQELRGLLSDLIQLFGKSRPLSEEEGRLASPPEERDALLAPEGETAALMLRMEESGLRQLWRITNLLLRTRKARAPSDEDQVPQARKKNVKNEDWSHNVVESKGPEIHRRRV
jgi:hypothetical protein